MTKRIKWKFKNTDVYFVTDESRLTLDVIRKAHAIGISPSTKIEIQNDYFTLTESDTTGCVSCGSGASTKPQPTVPVDNKTSGTKSKAVQLQPVSGDVDPVSPADSAVEDKPDLDFLDGFSDRVAL